MSTIDEVLAAAEVVDAVCVIDGETRIISVPAEYKELGVESDEKVTRVKFQCPKNVGDNIDLTEYNLYINYRNAGNKLNSYLVEDVTVTGDTINFSWLLSRHVTESPGTISYIVCAKKSDDTGVINEWNTKVATGIVGIGLEATEEIEEQNIDAIEQILRSIVELENKVDSGGSGGSSIATDEKLTEQGKAADAKATGDTIRSLSEEIANIPSGKDGADGQDGITPTIGENGNWYLGDTDTGKPSRGEKGDEGQPGKDGQDGSPGKDGNDGQPGKDGTSPVISVSAITGGHRITITDANGTKTVDVMDGSDGKNGADGQPGADGSNGQNGQDGSDGVGIQSVEQTTTSTEDGGTNVVTVTKTDGTSSTFSVKNGSKGSKGDTGADGAAGADGKSAYEYAVEGGYGGTEEEFASELGGLFGGSTVTVLSDNLFDKSIATTGKIFYHSASGPSLIDVSNGFYAYVPLRGAGTYTAMLCWVNHGESYAKRVPILKEDKTFLQNVTGTLTKIDSNFGYIEFTITETMISNGAALYAFDGSTNISPTLDEVMIVKDREYPSEYIPYGYIEVEVESADPVNILSGKTAVFLGDSICAGTTTLESAAEYGYGWGGLIGEANKMRWKNFGRNGGTIAPISSVEEARWVPTQVDLALAQYPDADYVIFEGGCNDADTLGESNIGTFSASGYAPTDTSTFTGAFEVLVLKILNSFPNAKIGYIVAQKMGVSDDYGSANNRYRKFFDRAVEICQKWGIPVIDLWNETPLNPKLAIHYDSSLTADQANENEKCYTDGQHLTLTGYKKLQNPVEEFMRKL